MLTGRLSSVSAETARLLRAAVLFGGRFGASDLAVVLRQPASDLAASLLDECAAIAARQGFPPRAASIERGRAMLTAPGSPVTASMLRDIEKGAPVEADHILGDLLARGGEPIGAGSLLRVAYAHVKAYEARRARETASTPKAA